MNEEQPDAAAPDALREANVEIDNGLHMRPVMAFVELANRFASDLTVTRAPAPDHDGRIEADAKSLYQVIELAAPKGTKLTIAGRGADAGQAVDELCALVGGGYQD